MTALPSTSIRVAVQVSLTLAMESGNRVFMAGTQLRNHDGAAFDRAAFDVIASVSVDFAILSASLVHPKQGFMVFDQCEVDMALAMKAICEHSIMAVDSTKFDDLDASPALRLPDLSENDFLITDCNPAPTFKALVNQANLIIA